MEEVGVVAAFYHSDTDVYAGARSAHDRLPAHNRYYYEVWGECIHYFLGRKVPVIIVNINSPAHAHNFFFHFPNFEIMELKQMLPPGTPLAYHYNFRSALWLGFKALQDKGVRYGVYIEQDVLINGKTGIKSGIGEMKKKKADVMGFRLADLKWFATELFIADVNFLVDNKWLSPDVGKKTFVRAEQLFDAYLERADAKLIPWKGMESARDLHPDPYGVNGSKYTHHRNPDEFLRFLELSGLKSKNIGLLKRFILERCIYPPRGIKKIIKANKINGK